MSMIWSRNRDVIKKWKQEVTELLKRESSGKEELFVCYSSWTFSSKTPSPVPSDTPQSEIVIATDAGELSPSEINALSVSFVVRDVIG